MERLQQLRLRLPSVAVRLVGVLALLTLGVLGLLRLKTPYAHPVALDSEQSDMHYRAFPIGRADQSTQAGLVIEYGDGRIETFCVDTGDPFGTSAEQLLLAAPIDVQMFREYGNIAVCRIGGTGCPAEHCYCAYAGDAPQSRLWMSYRLRNGVWQRPEPSEVNLSRRRVFPGDVEAWVWGHPGDGHGQGAASPSRVITLAEICVAATPTATLTIMPAPTDAPFPTDTTAPVATLQPTDSATPMQEQVSSPLEQNPPVIFPAASPTPPRLPTFVWPSPTVAPLAPVADQGVSPQAIYLPLVRSSTEEAAPTMVTPAVVTAAPIFASPTLAATVPPSPTPRLDLTVTAIILQTELALPSPSVTPHDQGTVGAGGARPPAPSPTSLGRGLSTPFAIRPTVGIGRLEVALATALPAYPTSRSAALGDVERPTSLIPWLALAVGIVLLTLLALVFVQRRVGHE